MGQTLEALHRLQAVELQLAEIRQGRESKVRRVDHHQRLVQKSESQLKEHRAAAIQRQIKQDALQLDVAAREQTIDRHRQALNKAKTNKEYSAVLEAMNTEKADNAKLEGEVLQMMEDAQALQEKIEAMAREQAEASERAAQAQAVLDDFDKRTRKQRKELEVERGVCAADLDPVILSSFTRVAERHDGEAMVSVFKLHPKRDDFACSGCNMKLTLDLINTLKTRDEVQICTSCARILYLEESLKQRSRA